MTPEEIKILVDQNNPLKRLKEVIAWDIVSSSNPLSEDTINKFSDCVNWKEIFGNQDLSENFISEHDNKLKENVENIDALLNNKNTKIAEEKKDDLKKDSILLKLMN